MNNAYAILDSHILAWAPKNEIIYEDSLSFLTKSPIKLNNFGDKKIKQIACNNSICHLITAHGQVFSWGNDLERTGLLGMNSLYNQPTPKRNNNFADKKIETISISDKHAIAIDRNHHCYTWGINQCGELGIASLSKNTMCNIPTIIDDKRLYIQKAKCGDKYTALMDYSGHLYYMGSLGNKETYVSHSHLSLSNASTPQLIPFNYQETCINDISCGGSVLGIIDTHGYMYLFNEDEGLNRIKLDRKIGQIALRRKCIYALGKPSDYLYVFSNPSSIPKITYYDQNDYEINKSFGKLTLIDSGYYNTNTIFFLFDCCNTKLFLLNHNKEALLKEVKPRNDRKIEINMNYLQKQDISFSDSVYPINSSSNLNKSSSFSVNRINTTTSKSNQRIEKISNLLEHIFDKQFDKLNETRSKSGKKKIEVERVSSITLTNSSKREYGFGIGGGLGLGLGLCLSKKDRNKDKDKEQEKDYKKESNFCLRKLNNIQEESIDIEKMNNKKELYRQINYTEGSDYKLKANPSNLSISSLGEKDFLSNKDYKTSNGLIHWLNMQNDTEKNEYKTFDTFNDLYQQTTTEIIESNSNTNKKSKENNTSVKTNYLSMQLDCSNKRIGIYGIGSSKEMKNIIKGYDKQFKKKSTNKASITKSYVELVSSPKAIRFKSPLTIMTTHHFVKATLKQKNDNSSLLSLNTQSQEQKQKIVKEFSIQEQKELKTEYQNNINNKSQQQLTSLSQENLGISSQEKDQTNMESKLLQEQNISQSQQQLTIISPMSTITKQLSSQKSLNNQPNCLFKNVIKKPINIEPNIQPAIEKLSHKDFNELDNKPKETQNISKTIINDEMTNKKYKQIIQENKIVSKENIETCNRSKSPMSEKPSKKIVLTNDNKNTINPSPIYSKVTIKHIRNHSNALRPGNDIQIRNPSTDVIYRKRIIAETSYQFKERKVQCLQVNISQSILSNINHHSQKQTINNDKQQDSHIILKTKDNNLTPEIQKEIKEPQNQSSNTNKLIILNNNQTKSNDNLICSDIITISNEDNNDYDLSQNAHRQHNYTTKSTPVKQKQQHNDISHDNLSLNKINTIILKETPITKVIKLKSKEALFDIAQNTSTTEDNDKSLYYQINEDNTKIFKVNNNRIEIISSPQDLHIEYQSSSIENKNSNSNHQKKHQSLGKSFELPDMKQQQRHNSPSHLQRYFSSHFSAKGKSPVKLITPSRIITNDHPNITSTTSNFNNQFSSYENHLVHSVTEANFHRSKSNNRGHSININDFDKKCNQTFAKNKSQGLINKQGPSPTPMTNNPNTSNNTNIGHKSSSSHSHQRSKTPLKLISKKSNSYYQPIKLKNNSKLTSLANDNREKILFAVEKLKEKYLSYLEKVYGNNKETILSSPSIENEDFLIKDFFNSEIINGDSVYLRPCESFLSQDELENFFYENLKFKHIKEKIKMNNDIIGDITRSNNFLSFDEEEEKNSAYEPLELERSLTNSLIQKGRKESLIQKDNRSNPHKRK